MLIKYMVLNLTLSLIWFFKKNCARQQHCLRVFLMTLVHSSLWKDLVSRLSSIQVSPPFDHSIGWFDYPLQLEKMECFAIWSLIKYYINIDCKRGIHGKIVTEISVDIVFSGSSVDLDFLGVTIFHVTFSCNQ